MRHQRPSWQPAETRHPLRRFQERKTIRTAIREGSGVFLFSADLTPRQVRRELYAAAMRKGVQVSLRLSPLELGDYRAYRVTYRGPLTAGGHCG